MKVYLVSSGEYSSYGINCVFSTKEKAEEYINLSIEYGNYNKDYFDIEEYDLDPEIKIPHNYKFKYFYTVYTDKEGNISHYGSGQTSISILNPEENERLCFTRSSGEITGWFGNDKSDRDYKIVLMGTINANDLEHAIKIIGEKRIKLITENKWPDDFDKDVAYMDVII